MMRTFIFLFILFIFCLDGILFPANKRDNIVILDLEIENITGNTGNIIRNKIEYHLFHYKEFNIINHKRFDKLKLENKLPDEKDSTTEYAVQAGKLLNADYVINGKIYYDDNYSLKLNLIRTDSGANVHAFEGLYSTDSELIESTVNAAAAFEGVITGKNKKSKTIDNRLKKKNIKKSDYLIDFPDFYASITGGYIPIQFEFSEFADDGYNITADTGLRNVLFRGVSAGIHVAYTHFNQTFFINETVIIPAIATLGYEFNHTGILRLAAGAGYGAAYSYVETKPFTKKSLESCGMISLQTEYYFNNNYALVISGNYYHIFKNDGVVEFISIGCGLKTLF